MHLKEVVYLKNWPNTFACFFCNKNCLWRKSNLRRKPCQNHATIWRIRRRFVHENKSLLIATHVTLQAIDVEKSQSHQVIMQQLINILTHHWRNSLTKVTLRSCWHFERLHTYSSYSCLFIWKILCGLLNQFKMSRMRVRYHGRDCKKKSWKEPLW